MSEVSDTRVCMVTGPTSGLGKALTLELAKRRFRLALVGRSETKLRELASECVALGSPEPVTFVCDMGSLTDVRRAAKAFLDTGLPLHALVHNAGLINQRRRVTDDGIEETYAVGFSSPFLLTHLLLEKLVASAPSQVIHTASGIYPIGRIDLDDPAAKTTFGPLASYARSKLASVSWTRTLAERLAPHGVRVNAYNPGMNYTNLAVGNNHSTLAKVGDFFWSRIADPVENGITVPLGLLTDPAMASVNGQVFMAGDRADMTAAARDPYVGAALVEATENLTGARWPASLASPKPSGRVRLGILGAARIAPFAVFAHVSSVPGVDLAALAEEYQPYASSIAYARKHGIPTLYKRFDKLLADPSIDAVYLALPISQHAKYALATIAAGKHLLCEKPLGANAEEAARIHEAQRGTGLVVAEAMHSLQHPLAARLRELLASEEIGPIRRVDVGFSAFIPQRDFRFVYELGGGCMLDMGCYPIAFLRAVLGTEPTVVNATAELVAPKIDGTMASTLAFPNAPDVRVFVGMRSLRRPLEVAMSFQGERGRVDLLNFIKPEVFHRLVIRTERGTRFERVPGGSTYQAQLASFIAATRGGPAMVSTTAEAVKTLSVIDAIYQKAGLPPRGT